MNIYDVYRSPRLNHFWVHAWPKAARGFSGVPIEILNKGLKQQRTVENKIIYLAVL